MRVTGGTAGGIPLLVPHTDLRPTMDRVKAAIFSSLGEKVPGSRVLDLFAGSGALGIDALSRGAREVIFVEKDDRAAGVIKKNLEKTRLDHGSVQKMDVFSFIHRNVGKSLFDIVFADPPYAKQRGERDFAIELLSEPALGEIMAPDGIFVLEKMPGQKLPLANRWTLIRERRYGATEVAFIQSAGK